VSECGAVVRIDYRAEIEYVTNCQRTTDCRTYQVTSIWDKQAKENVEVMNV